MRFLVNMTCDNAAFEADPTYEIGRILREVARQVEAGEATGFFQTIHDINGNDVGRFKLDGTERRGP